MESEEKIEELFTDSGPVDLNRLIDGIKSFVQVKRDTKEIFLKPDGAKLDVKRRILVYALTKMALSISESGFSPEISAVEVQKGLGGVPKGTIDAYFKKLKGSGFLVGSGKNYTVPSYKVEEVLGNLLKKGGED